MFSPPGRLGLARLGALVLTTMVSAFALGGCGRLGFEFAETSQTVGDGDVGPGDAGPNDAGAGPDDAGAGPDDAGAGPDDAGAGPGDAGNDSDQDGWFDLQETACGTDPLDPASTPSDFDGDGVCARLDRCPGGDDALDGDGDGIADLCENRRLWLDVTQVDALSESACDQPFTSAVTSVACWRDMSGYDNDAESKEAVDPTLDATALGGRGGVRFTTVERMQGQLVGMAGGDTPLTVFAVAEVFNLEEPGGANVFHVGASGCTLGAGLSLTPVSMRYYSWCAHYAEVSVNVTSEPFLVETWHVPGLYSAANTSIRVWGPGVDQDGQPLSTTYSTDSPVDMAADPLFTLGEQEGGSNDLDGSVGELMIFSVDLTETQRQSIISYLRDKWGL